MRATAVSVEPVEARTQLRRFSDVPYLLHHEDPRWRPGVRAWEQWRLDARRHPYFDRGDAAYLLARRRGQPVGRIVAHVASPMPEAGWFGFFDAPDDQAVVDALLDAAQSWLDEQGVSNMTGPVSWTPDEEFGVLVHGHDRPAATGLPWHPEWYAGRLADAGLVAGDTRHLYRIDCGEVVRAEEGPAPIDAAPPAHAGRYADPALVLEGIAAVPDVTATLTGASLRSAWRTARNARTHAHETAVCVRCDGDPAQLVPELARVARAAGYRWLLAPWAAVDEPPERSYQVFTRRW